MLGIVSEARSQKAIYPKITTSGRVVYQPPPPQPQPLPPPQTNAGHRNHINTTLRHFQRGAIRSQQRDDFCILRDLEWCLTIISPLRPYEVEVKVVPLTFKESVKRWGARSASLRDGLSSGDGAAGHLDLVLETERARGREPGPDTDAEERRWLMKSQRRPGTAAADSWGVAGSADPHLCQIRARSEPELALLSPQSSISVSVSSIFPLSSPFCLSASLPPSFPPSLPRSFPSACVFPLFLSPHTELSCTVSGKQSLIARSLWLRDRECKV